MSLNTNLVRENDIRNFLNAKPGIEDVEGVYQTKAGTLTADEVKALATTQITLVEAPGAGKVIEFLGGTFKNGGTVFGGDTNGDLQVCYTAPANPCSEPLDAENVVGVANAVGVFAKLASTVALANAPLVLDNQGSNFTGTGSVCSYNIIYRIVSL